MACSTDFIDFVCDTLSPLGEVRNRKMMGDYVIYVNEKCVITACDNTAFVKKLPCIESLMADAETGLPYPGAKEAYILDVSNQSLVLKVISILWDNLPFPKSKTKIKSFNPPTGKELLSLIGESLYGVWQSLCRLIDEKYEMEHIWNHGGKV